MSIQLSTTFRTNMMGQFESTVGASAKLQIRTGAQPANCGAADSGTLLAELSLPSDWMAAASAGAVAKTGTWSGTGAAAGNAGHFRIKDSGGTTTHCQGSITATSGGGDMELDNINIATSQPVSVSAFTLTAPGA